MRDLALACAGLVLACASGAQATVVYNNIPGTIPPNVDSVVFEDAAASAFGDAVRLAGEARLVTGVTVLLSNMAARSAFPGFGTAAGYAVSLTLSLYAAADSSANPAVGALLASRAVDAVIPWRPEASGVCNNGDYQAANGYCYSGVATTVTFGFSRVAVPGTVIAAIAFNTATAGAHPTGTASPIDQLGIGFTGTPGTGTDLNPDGVEWSTSDGSYRTLGVANVLGPDTGWSGYGSPAFRIDAAVPEPASWAVLAGGLVVVVMASFGRGWRRNGG